MWETIDEPRLLAIGRYRMWFELRTLRALTELRVGIDYELPRTGVSRLFGQLVGRFYAKWCTKQMVIQAQAAFEPAEAGLGS